MAFAVILLFAVGLAFFIFGFLIHFKKKYSLINGFAADYEAGLKTERYAKRVGLVEFILGVLTIIITTGVCIVLFSNHGSIGKTVTDFESLNLRLSGMRVTEEYEIIADGGQCEISYYNMFYGNGEEERKLVKRTTCDTQTLIDALNGFDFAKWNGFSGERPKGLLDGTDFRLTATINGGQRLHADGSANFPKHFHELEQWLYEELKDSEEIR